MDAASLCQRQFAIANKIKVQNLPQSHSLVYFLLTVGLDILKLISIFISMIVFFSVCRVTQSNHMSIAYRILFTMPVTVASAKRSFSKLKLLRNYLRSVMSQERLNSLATLCIEKGLLDEIDIDTIITDFTSRTVRRNCLNDLETFLFCILNLLV